MDSNNAHESATFRTRQCNANVTGVTMSCLGLGFLATTVSIISLFTAFWVKQNDTSFGLWDVCIKDFCTQLIADDKRVIATRVLGIVTVLLSSASVTMLAIYSFRGVHFCGLLSISTSLTSVLTSVLTWAVFLQYVGPKLRDNLSWSFVLFVIASSVQLMMGALLLACLWSTVVKPCSCRNNDREQDKNADIELQV